MDFTTQEFITQCVAHEIQEEKEKKEYLGGVKAQLDFLPDIISELVLDYCYAHKYKYLKTVEPFSISLTSYLFSLLPFVEDPNNFYFHYNNYKEYYLLKFDDENNLIVTNWMYYLDNHNKPYKAKRINLKSNKIEVIDVNNRWTEKEECKRNFNLTLDIFKIEDLSRKLKIKTDNQNEYDVLCDLDDIGIQKDVYFGNLALSKDKKYLAASLTNGQFMIWEKQKAIQDGSI